MPSIFVVGILTVKAPEDRQRTIDALTKVSNYSRDNEPGVLKHAIAIPRDPQDNLTVFAFEEYADRANMDAHIASDAVQELIAFFGSENSPLGGATEIVTTDTEYGFTRAELNSFPDPYIVFATIDHAEGKVPQALAGWANVTEATQQNEADTGAYFILKDKAHPLKLRTVEVYKSEAYLWDVHAKSAAVQENKAKNSDIRTGISHKFLKQVGGFLYKERTQASL